MRPCSRSPRRRAWCRWWRGLKAPADAGADNVYNVTLVVTDADANTASAPFTVTVTDVTETATLTLTKDNDTVAENAAYTGAARRWAGRRSAR